MRATATTFVGRRADGKRIVRAILYASAIPEVLPTTGEGIDGMSADDVFAAGSKLNVVTPSGTTRYIANEQGIFCLQDYDGGLRWDDVIAKPFETIGDGLSVDDDGALNAVKPYASLTRLASYLYDVSFAGLPDDIGVDLLPGGCTSFVQNGKLYRNLDFDYSELASFRVRCSGFEGMGFLPGLTDTELNDILIGQLPYNLVDGKNDSGIMAAAHILYNDWDWHGTANGIPLTRLVYHILTKVKSMETIETDLADILPSLVTTAALDAADYLMQFIVTDGTTTVAILPPTTSDGVYEIVDISANPKLTNFRWVDDETADRTDLQDRPTGVERWNMIPAPLEDLRFTAAYESPDRLSEFIGIDETDKDSTDEELEAIYEQAHALYEERTRDGSTWQTMYSVVYSSSGMRELYVQENWEKDYVHFGLPPVTDADEGKFMRVVDGEWAAAEVETTTMTVTYDDDTTETFSIFVESAT